MVSFYIVLLRVAISRDLFYDDQVRIHCLGRNGVHIGCGATFNFRHPLVGRGETLSAYIPHGRGVGAVA